MTASPIVPISMQIREVERELDQREDVYARFVAAKRMKVETAESRKAAMRAVLATLRTVSAHADGLRLLIQHLRHETEAETKSLLGHAAVRGLLETFPDAVLSGISPIKTTTPEVKSEGTDT